MEIGIQSYVYRRLPLEEMLVQVKASGARAVELWERHLAPGAGEAEVGRVLGECRRHGLRVCGYGVVNLSQEPPETPFALARRLGADYVSVDVLPEDRPSQAEAVRCGAAHGLKLALHNHGPKHHFSNVADVLSVLQAWPSVFGACVDTGHFLRSGVDPVVAVEQLGPRVHAIHLRDFSDDGTEVLPGSGRLDLPRVVSALRTQGFASAFVLEYETGAPHPTPLLNEAVRALERVLSDSAGGTGRG